MMMMMMASPPLITSDDSYSPRPASSSSRHRGGSRPGSPASLSFNSGRYSPPCPLDLTPKQPSAATLQQTAASHIMSAYLPPAFTGLMAGTATSAAGLPGHGPSFGPSGKHDIVAVLALMPIPSSPRYPEFWARTQNSIFFFY